MGRFVHLELSTNNTKKAKGFYSKVFGWKFDDMKTPQGSIYSMVKGQMAPGAAVQKAPMPDMPSGWLAYIEVDDVTKTVAKAGKAGAKIAVPYFSVPGYGEGAWMIDPTGAPIAIWHSLAPKASSKKRSKRKTKKTAKKKVTKKKTKKKTAKKTAKKRVKKKAKRKTKATSKRAKTRR